jgi:hypothetical protein
LRNCSAGIIASAMTGTVSAALTSSRCRRDAASSCAGAAAAFGSAPSAWPVPVSDGAAEGSAAP